MAAGPDAEPTESGISIETVFHGYHASLSSAEVKGPHSGQTVALQTLFI